MPPKRDYTSGQKKIINRYYEHRETISAHKLAELVSEIALAAGDAKKLDRLWTRDRIHRQALQIGETGGKLLDALQGFLEDFEQVGTRLDAVQKSYGNAKRRLDDSNRSVLARARRLTELGVRGKKALREELKPDGAALALPGAEDEPALAADGDTTV